MVGTGENTGRSFDRCPPREARPPSTPASVAGWRLNRRRPPRTATPASTETDFRPATQRVFRTDPYPTAIELTVLPD
jgi:hypothetical protein